MGLCNFLCWFFGLYFVFCIRKVLGTQFHLVFGFLRSIVDSPLLLYFFIQCDSTWYCVTPFLFLFLFCQSLYQHQLIHHQHVNYGTNLDSLLLLLFDYRNAIFSHASLLPPLDLLLGEVHVAFLALKLAVHHHFVFFFGHLFQQSLNSMELQFSRH